MNTLPVAIIGAGPVGLAAAAHVLERGETPLVFEMGTEVGANIRQWQHVRMFSPWEFTVDSASRRLLESHAWQMPPKDELPTGKALIDLYLAPLAALPELRSQIHYNAQVVAVSRRNVDKMKDAGRESAPFVLHIAYGDGSEALIEARAVIDASGTWQKPNPMGANGLPAMGEKRHTDRIAYGIPDILGSASVRYANRRVAVIGSGHSALNALLELVELQKTQPKTQIIWLMRSTNLARVYGGGENDALAARGQLGTRIQAAVAKGIVSIHAPFSVEKVESTGNALLLIGQGKNGTDSLNVDEVIVATGARPDFDMLRELRLTIDPALESSGELAPMIDPNIHSCGTVRPHGEAELRQPEKDFYIVGMKSYGRAPTFLLATGYEQVRSIAAALVGDWEAAQDVQLNLPETGVCSSDFAEGEGAACCGTSAVQAVPTINLTSIRLNVPVANLALSPQGVAVLEAVSDCGCDDTCCTTDVQDSGCCGSDCCS